MGIGNENPIQPKSYVFALRIYGNREFVDHLRNQGKFFDHEEKRERDLILIDYDDPSRNVYEVTEEWSFHNGHYGARIEGPKTFISSQIIVFSS